MYSGCFLIDGYRKGSANARAFASREFRFPSNYVLVLRAAWVALLTYEDSTGS